MGQHRVLEKGSANMNSLSVYICTHPAPSASSLSSSAKGRLRETPLLRDAFATDS